jgi:hypothetical protein
MVQCHTSSAAAALFDGMHPVASGSVTAHRKMTAIRSLFSYLQTYGYTGANPAHGKFVKAPSVAATEKQWDYRPRIADACSILLTRQRLLA